MHVIPQLKILNAKTAVVSTTELAIRGACIASRRWARHAGEEAQGGGARDRRESEVRDGCHPDRADGVRACRSRVVSRIQDARIRGCRFTEKIGAGLTVDQFLAKVADGSVRHVGFTQSIAMIGDALGWKLDRITDEVKPRIADTMVASDLLAVDPGYVCGIVQDGIGYRNGKPVITLHLEAYLGAPESYDSVEIDGSPKLSMKFAGGIHGDIATVSMVINAMPKPAAPRLHDARASLVLRAADHACRSRGSAAMPTRASADAAAHLRAAAARSR